MVGDPERTSMAIASDAAEWLVAQRAGRLGEAERQAFLVWLRASPRHVEEYLRIAAVDRLVAGLARRLEMPLADELAADVADLPANVVEFFTRVRPASRPAASVRSRYGMFAAAGAIAVAFIATAIWASRDGERFGLARTYQTAKSEQGTWRLPDGSVLHVNTESAATVRYSRAERLVTVDRGEAFFDVMRDHTRRFRAVASGVSTVAVGTKFDVYRQGEATVVTVEEGQVAVFSGDAAPAAVSSALRVDAGQQVRVVGGVVPPTTTAVDLGQAVGWLERQISFEQQPLGTVAAEFNRYGRVPLQIEDPSLRALLVSGVFDPYDVESFIAFLETLDGVAIDRTPGVIRVYRARAPAPAR